MEEEGVNVEVGGGEKKGDDVQEVMSGAPHRFCAMHFWKNFIK